MGKEIVDDRTPRKGTRKISINPEPFISPAIRSLASFSDTLRPPASPSTTIGSSGSSSSTLSAGDMFSLDQSLLEGCTRYRTCKFRNSPKRVSAAPPRPPSSRAKAKSSHDNSSATGNKVESSKKDKGTPVKVQKSSSATKVQEAELKDTGSLSDSGESTAVGDDSSSEEEPKYCLCNKVSSCLLLLVLT